MRKPYSFGVWNFSSTADRFLPSGYRQGVADPLEMTARAVQVPGIAGLEFIYPDNLNEDNASKIGEILREKGLSISTVLPNLHGEARWQRGTIASIEPAIRAQAINRVKAAIDLTATMGGDLINLWPGQDGYDYFFQADYIRQWDLLAEAVRELALHNPQVRISLEYKPREPRTHSFLATCHQCLVLIGEIGLPNVGVTVDVGHALNCRENLAETVAVLKRSGDKLFHLHLNDNHGLWDDDMVVGSVNTVGYLEMLHWLENTGYNGWYSLDIYPYREDSFRAVTLSLSMLEGLLGLLGKIGGEVLNRAVAEGDHLGALEIIRGKMLP